MEVGCLRKPEPHPSSRTQAWAAGSPRRRRRGGGASRRASRTTAGSGPSGRCSTARGRGRWTGRTPRAATTPTPNLGAAGKGRSGLRPRSARHCPERTATLAPSAAPSGSPAASARARCPRPPATAEAAASRPDRHPRRVPPGVRRRREPGPPRRLLSTPRPAPALSRPRP